MFAISVIDTISSYNSVLPEAKRRSSSSGARSKWSSIGLLPRLVIMRISVIPDCTASSTMYWIAGLSTIGSISFGIDLEAGRTRVPRPAAGMIALVTFIRFPPLNDRVMPVKKQFSITAFNINPPIPDSVTKAGFCSNDQVWH